MKAILKSAVFSIFILTLAAAAKAQSTDEAKVNSIILTEAKITGAWRINYAESDNPILKMQQMLQSKLAAPTDEKTAAKVDAIPAMSVSLVPPESLVLADDEKSITINENFSEIVFTRTVLTDGVKRNGELSNGMNFSVAASGKTDALKVETESPRGNRMIEIYAVSANGKKLIVTVRFENEQAKELLTLRRVYDRTLVDIFPAETEEIQ